MCSGYGEVRQQGACVCVCVCVCVCEGGRVYYMCVCVTVVR